MNTAIKAVIFDWAGTVVDFGSRAPVLAIMQVFDDEGMSVSEALVRKYMGYAKRDHLVAMLSEHEGRALWRKTHELDWTEADVDRMLDRLVPLMTQCATDRATLIPGAKETIETLGRREIRIGSTTGYTRAMMAGIIPLAAKQGYDPETIVCAGETQAGRPAPLMIWRALETLGVWPVHACIKVDDAPVGIEAGVNAGLWTVGVAGSGNGSGLSLDAFAALTAQERAELMGPVSREFESSGADFVLKSIADLPQVLDLIERRIAKGKRPGAQPCERLL